MNIADLGDAVRQSISAQLDILPPIAAVSSLLFNFESDYAKTLCCMPMIVRYKLDECRIKLSLQDWQSLDLATRKRLITEDLDPLGGKKTLSAPARAGHRPSGQGPGGQNARKPGGNGMEPLASAGSRSSRRCG